MNSYNVVKDYGPRGLLHQFRVAPKATFKCHRCGREKVSPLITVYNNDANTLVCNGCYGLLLSRGLHAEHL